MNCSIFAKIALVAFVFLSGCSNTDPLNQLANSFVSQLFSGMTFSEYVELKNQYYPPVGDGVVLATGCLNAGGEQQNCNEVAIDTTTKLTYFFTKAEVIANCEAYLCFPSNLADQLSYDGLMGNTQPIADRIQAGLVDWGTGNRPEEVYIFFDETKKYLIGIMFDGDLGQNEVQFFK